MSRKVTLVSYINTLPYLEVLRNSRQFELDLRVPSECADAFKDYSSDIALVPVGSLADIQRPYRRIDSFGIGGDGEVRTVKLLSHKKKEELTEIALDIQSATSVQLVRILADRYWGLVVSFTSYNVGDNLPEAVLAIGDKVFELESHYEFSYDMSQEWKNWLDLPFAFAVWIISDEYTTKEEDEFRKLLEKVPDVIDAVIEKQNGKYENYDLESYLKKNIKYSFGPDYKKAIELFLQYQLSLAERL